MLRHMTIVLKLIKSWSSCVISHFMELILVTYKKGKEVICQGLKGVRNSLEKKYVRGLLRAAKKAYENIDSVNKVKIPNIIDRICTEIYGNDCKQYDTLKGQKTAINLHRNGPLVNVLQTSLENAIRQLRKDMEPAIEAGVPQPIGEEDVAGTWNRITGYARKVIEYDIYQKMLTGVSSAFSNANQKIYLSPVP